MSVIAQEILVKAAQIDPTKAIKPWQAVMTDFNLYIYWH